MATIERTTRATSIRRLNPKLLKGLKDYSRANGLGALESEAVLCCETVTSRENPGRLAAWLDGNPDSADVLGLVLARQYLLWARTREHGGTIVYGADLRQIRVRPYASKLPREAGLEISGFVGAPVERVRGKLALGPEPAAKEFVDAVIRAVKEAKPPSAKREIPWLKWFSRRE